MENSVDKDKREVFFLPDGLLDELDELPKVTVEENVLARTDGTFKKSLVVRSPG